MIVLKDEMSVEGVYTLL